MCGRFVRFSSMRILGELFQCPAPPEVPARYNVAPTQPLPVVRVLRAGEGGVGREWAVVRWGLIPPWADDPSIGNRLINARAETAAEKPSFRNAFKKRRCLVPADGFYEWPKTAKKGPKQPYLIRLKSGQPFAFAGLWESWTSPDGEVIESCTILTTEANEALSAIHDRMPVIIAPEDYDRWLDPATPLEEVQSLLRPYPAEEMERVAVSTLVNNPRHDAPECVEPLA